MLAFVLCHEDVGRDDDILGKIFGYTAAEHEQARHRVVELDLRQLVKILGAVEAGFGLPAALVIMGYDTQAGGAIGKRGAEDGHAVLIGGVDN